MTTRIVLGALIILIGLGFLFDVNIFRILFPLFLIFIGLRILTGQRHGMWDHNPTTTSEDSLNRVMIFSGINQKIASDNFTRAELVAIFGGGDLDLSGVKTKAKIVDLNLVAVFGGLKVRIPADWKVSSEGVGIIGGFSNNTQGVGPITVRLKGVAIFGGVEVVN